MTRVVLWMNSTDPQKSGFESGFNVFSQQIYRNNAHPTRLRQGILPSCPIIPELHSLWLTEYNSLNDRTRTILLEKNNSLNNPTRITWGDTMPIIAIAQSDIEACGNSRRELEEEMQRWLNNKDSGWRNIREDLRGELGDGSSKAEICILIQADEILIWQLPWLFWDLLSQSSTGRRVRITFGHL